MVVVPPEVAAVDATVVVAVEPATACCVIFTTTGVMLLETAEGGGVAGAEWGDFDAADTAGEATAEAMVVATWEGTTLAWATPCWFWFWRRKCSAN